MKLKQSIDILERVKSKLQGYKVDPITDTMQIEAISRVLHEFSRPLRKKCTETQEEYRKRYQKEYQAMYKEEGKRKVTSKRYYDRKKGIEIVTERKRNYNNFSK